LPCRGDGEPREARKDDEIGKWRLTDEVVCAWIAFAILPSTCDGLCAASGMPLTTAVVELRVDRRLAMHARAHMVELRRRRRRIPISVRQHGKHAVGRRRSTMHAGRRSVARWSVVVRRGRRKALIRLSPFMVHERLGQPHAIRFEETPVGHCRLRRLRHDHIRLRVPNLASKEPARVDYRSIVGQRIDRDQPRRSQYEA